MKKISSRFRGVVQHHSHGVNAARRKGHVLPRAAHNTAVSSSKTTAQRSFGSQPKRVLSWTQYVRLSARFAKLAYKAFVRRHRTVSRIIAILISLMLLFSIIYEIRSSQEKIALSDIGSKYEQLIGKPTYLYTPKLISDKQGGFTFNKDYKPVGDVAGQSATPKISASYASSNSGAVTVNDPTINVGVTFTPKFAVKDPVQSANRIVYPLVGGNAYVVYTNKGTGVKEDIVVKRFSRDKMSFEYELGLPEGTEARVESDGSIGVYGVDSALLGNVTTGTDMDAELLQKARTNGKKTKLLFYIPKPFIAESYKKLSKSAKAYYELKGSKLVLVATGLKDASYPLSIDPTIYVETARKLMRGNNESNIDFDVDDELIQKSQTTGARIDAWSSTTNLSSAVYGQGTAVAGGFIYSVGGVGSGTTNTTSYSTATSTTYVVPAGVSYVTVKTWGAGGAGGNGSGGTGTGGSGGAGGYAKAVISVTPGESLTVVVGSGGADSGTVSSGGGNGGGFSALLRSGTYLVQAGGGGGGGGSRGSNSGDGGAGGAGGGASGLAGTVGEGSSAGGGGGGGTSSAGGTAGAAGSGGTAGAAGVANAGGNGAGSDAATCNDAMEAADTGGNGGQGGGGADGNDTSSCSNGGGGGGGRYGGGGGGSHATNNNRGGGGGGGGSSYVNPTGLVSGTDVQTAGSGTTPGNSGDSDRGSSGNAGSGGTSTSGGTAGTDGRVVISYTSMGSVTDAVYWAQFNTSTNAIESPNPGNGTCTGWCTDSDYVLPAALTNLSLVAYNGYLYAMGGQNSSGTPQTTVYIAKLGANGEPQLWHPTGGTPTYWYSDTSLTNARSQFAAAAYNNRMYILGGLTTSTTVLSSNTVQYANMNPNGTLTAFTSTGMQALSGTGGGNRYGLTAHIYNSVIYVIGGDATFSGSPVANVDYAKLNSDGTMNSWVATDSLESSGRLTLGGSFSTVFGGYMYVNGGCTAVNASGYCTAIASDVQLSSINSDGSLGGWNTILGLTNDRFAHTMIAWQGGLYRLGGCRAQDPGTGGCSNTALDVDYGVINPDGEASTVNTSSASGVSPCTGTSAYSCDVPTSYIGNMSNLSIIANGFLYIMGGCTNNACSTQSRGVTYQKIGSTGQLEIPLSCSGTLVDSYCVSSISLPAQRGGSSMVFFNNRIYAVGGFTGTAIVTDILYTDVNSDGSINAWQTSDLSTIGATDVSWTFAYARSNPSSAGSVPGNMYIFGGCTNSGGTGIGCASYTDSVVKCNISTTGAVSLCNESGQTQIGTPTGASGAGLGAHVGAVYANYIYLMGGLGSGVTDLTEVRYAKFDDSNNVVESDGSGTAAWTISPNEILIGRRRGAGFGYNGYLYITGGYDGTDALADIEFTQIDVSSGAIGAWDSSSVSINRRWALSVTVSNSYAYVIGGCTHNSTTGPTGCDTRTNTIQTFQIYNNDSGTPVGYTPSTNQFATDRIGAGTVIYNGFIYIAGGCESTTTDCDNATDNVQFASLDVYGTISSWSNTSDATLPAVRAHGKLLEAGGTLYWVGGQNDAGTAQSDVYYGVPDPSTGNVSSWSTASNGLPAARSQFGAASWNDRLYVTGGVNSGTVQSTVYVSPELSSSVSGGNIGSSWSTSTSFDVARSGHTTIAYANNLYVLGGYDGTNYLSDSQFATLGYKTGTISQSGTTVTGSGTTFTSAMVGSTVQYGDGSTAEITGYTSATSISVDISKSVTAGSIYTVLDGSVGAWTFTTALPVPLRQADGFAANGYMYLVGGRVSDTDCSPRTLVAPISANTTILTGNNPTGVGEWFQSNVKYEGRRYGASVAYANGKYYTSGGVCNGFPTVRSVLTQNFSTAATSHNVTMPATVNSGDLLMVLFTNDFATGGTTTVPSGWTQNAGWTSTQGAAGVRAGVFIKVASGSEDGSTVDFVTSVSEEASSQVYLIPAGEWSGTTAGVEVSTAVGASTSTPNPGSLNPGAWGIENTLWISYAGGSSYSSTTTYPTNYRGGVHNLSNTGTGGASTSSSWLKSASTSEDPGTFTMANSTDSVAFTIAVRPSGYSLTGANKIVQTAVYAQPQVAIYSKMIDTDTDVFPTSWLINGLDNSTGARWQVRYRSMHDINTTSDVAIVSGSPVLQQNPSEDCGTSTTMPVMTTWGQETNYGDVIMGDVAPYTAVNSSGGNINCARYFYFYVSIDASQTFGYPEDVTRGPTIADLSLFFTSDPSKRLRHGKTFTGGEQQPLDTPCRQSVDAQCPLP